MIHDQKGFAAAAKISGAYQGDVASRVRRFLPMVRRLVGRLTSPSP